MVGLDGDEAFVSLFEYFGTDPESGASPLVQARLEPVDPPSSLGWVESAWTPYGLIAR